MPRGTGSTWTRVLLGALGLVGLLTACGGADDAVDVFAAASLTNAFTEIAAAYEAEGGGPIRLNFAGSSSLREQIRDGAEADVFASANDQIMDELVAEGLITAAPVPLATNELVLAVPIGNPGKVEGLADLADDGRFVGLCSVGVPCGDLARTVLQASGVEASVDTELPDVRALARRIADGELDAGLVYATDVVADPTGLEIVVIGGDPATVEYPIARLASSDTNAAGFVDFVLSSAGSAILERWGFRTP